MPCNNATGICQLKGYFIISPTTVSRFEMVSGYLNDLGTKFIFRVQLKCDSTRAETRFRLSAKRTSPFKWAGGVSSFDYWQPGFCASAFIVGSNAGYTMFRGSVKGTGYPLHSPVSPSLPFPRVTVYHHISTGVYYIYIYIFFFSVSTCFGRLWARHQEKHTVFVRHETHSTLHIRQSSTTNNKYQVSHKHGLFLLMMGT